MDLVIITLSVVVGFLIFVAVMSFATWENGFRMMGRGYIIRMIIVLITISWVLYFIPGAEK